MTYEVTIQLLETTQYKGIFSFENGKIYIRSLIDEDEYESMFWQLIKRGYVQVDKVGGKCNITLEEFNNNLVQLFEKLQNDGLELEYIESDSAVFSLVADGDDLNPEVIAHIGKGTRFIQGAESMYRYVNDISYEPKIQIRSASYAVDIQDMKNDDISLKAFINEINEEYVDAARYLQNNAYAKALHSLFDIVAVTTLKTLNIVVSSQKEPLEISINALKNMKKNFKETLSSSLFKESLFAQESMRAFDDKKYRALLDISPVYHLHFESEALYKKAKEMYDTNKEIIISGTYKSKLTIDVSSVVAI